MANEKVNETIPIGEFLNAFMKKHRFTSYELAPKIGVTRATLGRWIQTGHVPQERMLRALLTLMNEGRM